MSRVEVLAEATPKLLSHARPNILLAGAHRQGRWTLEGVPSWSARSGPLLKEVRCQLGRAINEITVNRNLKCEPHVAHNGGPFWIAMFGQFTGGELCVGKSRNYPW